MHTHPPQVYHLPINEAAAALNIGVTVLKKYCRKFRVPRWPYRKLQSMGKLIESFQRYKKGALGAGNTDEAERCEVGWRRRGVVRCAWRWGESLAPEAAAKVNLHCFTHLADVLLHVLVYGMCHRP